MSDVTVALVVSASWFVMSWFIYGRGYRKGHEAAQRQGKAER